MNRRTVMQALGIGALTAPAMATELTQEINLPQGGAVPPSYPPGWRLVETTPNVTPGTFAHHAKRALADPTTQKQILDAVWRDNRTVGSLDPDLAVNRSFSLCAKIAYQRQRNVQRQLTRLQTESNNAWDIVHRFIRSILNPLG